MVKKTDSLTSKHPAVKLLVKIFKDGSITDDMKAATIDESDPLFRQTNLDNFRNAVKRYRKPLFEATGVESKYLHISIGFLIKLVIALIDSESKLESRSTENINAGGSTKKRKVSDVSDGEEIDSDDDFGVEHIGDQKCYHPMVAQSIWNEHQTTTKRLTCAIVLPAGIDAGDFSVCVLEGGLYSELKCQWPNEIVDMGLLHCKWLGPNKMQRYHPKLLGFEQFFNDLRKPATDTVQSTCRIPLPLQVETHIVDKLNLQWTGATKRVVYVDLRAAAEEYGIINETEEFETVR